MATTPPPQKCIILSSHGNFQYKEKTIPIICAIKRKNKKAASILLKFFPKIILSFKKRMARLDSCLIAKRAARLAIGGKLTRRKPGGCPHCQTKAWQNIGLPRINFNLES